MSLIDSDSDLGESFESLEELDSNPSLMSQTLIQWIYILKTIQMILKSIKSVPPWAIIAPSSAA